MFGLVKIIVTLNALLMYQNERVSHINWLSNTQLAVQDVCYATLTSLGTNQTVGR